MVLCLDTVVASSWEHIGVDWQLTERSCMHANSTIVISNQIIVGHYY